MLTADGCLARRARLWDRLPSGIDWVLIADPRHVLYLSGFLIQPLSFSVNERGWLLLERQGPATLLADNFARRSALAAPFVDIEELETWYDHRHSVIDRDAALLASLARVAPRLQSRSGLIEGEWLPALAAELLPTGAARLPTPPAGGPAVGGPTVGIPAAGAGNARGVTTLGELLLQLRRQKDPDELATLQLAMDACAAGHAAALRTVAPGVTEFEVYRAIHAAVLEQAGRPVQIYGDFRANDAAVPKRGGPPTGERLTEGSLYLLDYSVIIDGYRSDFTNTVCAGVPTAAQRELFDWCHEALQAGAGALRAGVTGREVYEATAGPLRRSPHGATFTHHAGHGLGMAHPEAPILVAESVDTLLPGDVVTVEPGLYVPGIGGIRLEHNYLVTAEGSQVLSRHTLALTPGDPPR